MIPTSAGFRPLSELRPGGAIFGRDGRLHAVLAESEVVTAPAWRLVFDDGAALVAHDDHQWLTFDAKELAALTRLSDEWRARRRTNRASRTGGRKSAIFTATIVARNRAAPPPKKPAPAGTVRTTAEIVATLRTPKGRANHAVPVAEPLELPAKALPLDPYVLGVWLGDGTTKTGDITTADAEIVAAVAAAGYPVRRIGGKANNKASTYSHTGLRQALKGMGLLGNKHAPPDYLWASREQRLALLQGLLDTDGGVEAGKASFTSTRRVLAEAVAHLARSLGHKATVREGLARLNGRVIGPKWAVKFAARLPVFRLPRKLARLKYAERRTTRFRYVVSVERVAPVAMKCLQVAAEDHLYLAGEHLVPTHNSQLLVGLGLTAHRNTLLLRRTNTDAKGLSEALLALCPAAGTWKWHGNGGELRTRDGRLIEVGGCQHEAEWRKYMGRAHDLRAFDELPHFTERQYRSIIGWNRVRDPLRHPHQRSRVVAAGNPPTRPEEEWVLRYWRAWLDPERGERVPPGELRWYVEIDGKDEEFAAADPVEHKGRVYRPRSRTFIPARLEDNPAYLASGYDAVLDSMPEPYRSILRHGDMTAAREDDRWQLIPSVAVAAAQRRWMALRRPDAAPERIGIDVAMGGGDKTVVAHKYGRYIDALVKRPGRDTATPETVLALVLSALAGTAAPVNLDATGQVGADAYDSTQGRNSGLVRFPMKNVVPVNFGAGSDKTIADGSLGFANVRAEMFWNLRELLTTGPEDERLALPPDPELAADLCAVRWRPRAGKVLVEPKDDGTPNCLRARLGRSTDCGDAVALACWEPPSAPKVAFSGRKR